MNAHRSSRALIALLLGFGLAACVEIPPGAFDLAPDTLQRQQMQTRVFDTADERRMLSASAGVLQDLGFQLDESETDLGLIVASKRRDARVAAGTFAAWFLSELLSTDVETEEEQLIRASLVTRPSSKHGGRVSVRVIFQRTLWFEAGGLIPRRRRCRPGQ